MERSSHRPSSHSPDRHPHHSHLYHRNDDQHHHSHHSSSSSSYNHGTSSHYNASNQHQHHSHYHPSSSSYHPSTYSAHTSSSSRHKRSRSRSRDRDHDRHRHNYHNDRSHQHRYNEPHHVSSSSSSITHTSHNTVSSGPSTIPTNSSQPKTDGAKQLLLEAAKLALQQKQQAQQQIQTQQEEREPLNNGKEYIADVSPTITQPSRSYTHDQDQDNEESYHTIPSSSTTNNTPLFPHSTTTTQSSLISQTKLPSWITHNSLFSGCRYVNSYRPIHAIDEGTYGKVWLAEDKETGEKVALKQIKFDKISTNEGFPLTALREINILLTLKHPNIICVREMVIGNSLDKVYMVMDYMPHNLSDFLHRLPAGTYFTQAEIKCLMLQLLQGMAFMHEKWFIHRDLKTQNLLINNQGILNICDYGLARYYGQPLLPYTQPVVTLWYRAPELLLGAPIYGPEIDMWSIGCIFAELLTKKPLFHTRNEAETIKEIFKLFGTPNDNQWPQWKSLPLVKTLRAHERNYPPQNIRKVLRLGGGSHSTTSGGMGFTTTSSNISDQGIDLLMKMLDYNPETRITAIEALDHPWFQETPLPIDPRLLPAFPSDHD